MKLSLNNIKFSNFKSLTDCRLEVDPSITAIVGENETGKTNILIAINKFNKDQQFDPNIDKRQHSSEDPKLTLTFKILGDNSEILGILGAKKDDRIKTLTISKQGDKYTVESPRINLEKSLFYHQEKERLEREANQRRIDFIQSKKAELEAAGEDPNTPIDAPEYPFEVNIQSIEEKIVNWVINKISIKYFLGRASRSQEENMTELLPDEVLLKNLKASPKKYQSVVNLLSIGGISVHDFPDQLDQVHKLKMAARTITTRINEYWKQEPIEIDILYQRDHVVIKVKDGRIEDEVWLGPQSRSDGFQWYLAFYIHFLGQLEHKVTDSILLLDEPGIFLHADGQKDLLRLLEAIAKNGNQIIYTNHSPFMINSDYVERVRFLEKQSEGTVIGNTTWSQGGQGILPEPIRAALGMLLSDSLLYGKTNLVVEGPSDKIYIRALNERLCALGKKDIIDLERISILPSYSATKMTTTVSFLKNESLRVFALADSDGSGTTAVGNLIAKGILKPNEIRKVSDINKDCLDIEDLIPIDRLLDAVNDVYGDRYDNWTAISKTDIPNECPPIVPKLMEILKKRGITGDLEKVKIAEYVAAKIEQEWDIVDDKGKVKSEWKNAEKLVKELYNLTKPIAP